MASSPPLNWSLEKKELPLRLLWKISRGALRTKETYFVRLSDGVHTEMGEVSPNSRYGNTSERIEADFRNFLQASNTLPEAPLTGIQEFHSWLTDLGLCQALRFGVESAWVHRQARKQGKRVSEYLGLPPPSTKIPTCISIPIMPIGELEAFLKPLNRFPAIKVKVDAESAADTLRVISRHTSQKIRIDGNEDWRDPDQFLLFVEGLKGMNIEMLEQPLPAEMTEAYREILPKLPYLLVADESITDFADFDDLKTQFSGVNIKLMKTGGYLRAIQLLTEAHAHGMKTMLGCMVETSLGISSAMHLTSLADFADLDGFLLLKEDPFSLVKEQDGNLLFN